jgi:aryl-alcohol dehydrogenase-like predicted oxidoreductase
MEYRKLGSTGTAVSRIALGTMDFGSITPQEQAFEILDAFMDAGGNLIDTSNVYNGGLVEEILGRWLSSRPSEVTDRVVLASKGRFGPSDPDVNGLGLSRRSLSRSLDGSLRRLGRETIDLYQLHGWDPLTPVEETVAFLADAVRAGKVNYVGLSNFTGWQLQLIVSTARAMGAPIPVTLQQQYSLLSRESEYEMVPAAAHNGLGLLPWSPLAGGFLTGKYTRGGTAPTDTRAGSGNVLYQWTSQEYASSDRNWATVDTVTAIAQQAGVSPAQVALAWIADRPGVTAPIVGARNVHQLAQNLGAAELHLDAEATATLAAVSAPQPGGYPYGAFGTQQRDRKLAVGGGQGLAELVARGSETPLAR